MMDAAIARAILDLARWAPSGDNTQPWRFQIISETHVVVHGFDTRDHCVYDLDGHASQISLGALLECIALAATRFGLRTDVALRAGSSEARPIFDVRFRKEDGLSEDALVPYIAERRVQRRPMRVRRLSEREKRCLEDAVAPGFKLSWFESWSDRAKMAWLNFANAKLRLTLPEAYAVHRDVIDWEARLSEDRIPAAALGASAPTLVLMRWAMASWNRIAFLNRYFAGTLAPRIELDLLPGVACAAHCVLLAKRAPDVLEEHVAAGRMIQRFWLTATRLRMQFQPQYTPLVFARYAREGLRFSTSAHSLDQAKKIRAALDGLLGADAARAVFMGRIGGGKAAAARSIRLPLDRLLLDESVSLAGDSGGRRAQKR